MAWSNFSTEKRNKFIEAIEKREAFNSGRSGHIGSFHGYATNLWCHGCEEVTPQYLVYTFDTILARECQKCKTMHINTCTSVGSTSSKYHARLLMRGLKYPKDFVQRGNIRRGDRYIQ